MKSFTPVSEELDCLGHQIVDSAYRVHSQLGPGLLEPVYEECMLYDLGQKGLHVEKQVEIPITYFEHPLRSKFRLDVLVDNSVIIELKAVEKMIPLYQGQLLTYLRLSKKRLGFLINFNVPLIKNGIQRIVI